MRARLLLLLALAAPAAAQESPGAGSVSSFGSSSGTAMLATVPAPCSMATLSAEGKVVIDDKCLDASADRCEAALADKSPGSKFCEQWDSVAVVLRAVRDGKAERR